MMWQFNNQMIAKTLVFSNIRNDLGSSLVKIYQDLKPSRIGVSENMIFTEIISKLDDFELLTQSQTNGIYEVFQENEIGKSIDSCQRIFSSLEEIRRQYNIGKSQIESSPQSLLQEQNLVFEGNNGCQIQLFAQEQSQKSSRENYQKNELLILQCHTITLDIQDQDKEIGQNSQVQLQQSIAIDIAESLQQNIAQEKSLQSIPNSEQIKKEGESSFEIAYLSNDTSKQKQITLRNKPKIQSPLIQIQKYEQSRTIQRQNEEPKKNTRPKYFWLYLTFLFACLILAISFKII